MIFAPRCRSVSLFPQIVDDLGLPVTGLVAATMPSIYWMITGRSLPSAISLSDLAAQNSAWSAGGVKEMTGGYYRLDVPNDGFAYEGQGRIVGEASGKRLVHPAYQINAVLARKQPHLRLCSKTTGGTALQLTAWLADGERPLNLNTLDPSATCQVNVYLHGSGVAAFTVNTAAFGAPDATLGRFDAEYSNPNLTADRIYLADVTIVSEGITYTSRKSFTPIP